MKERWAALAMLALLLVPGCLGGEEGPRLAQPTDEPIVVPTPTPKRPTVTYDLSDPGYSVTTAWHVGDGWDYESNQSSYRLVRVVDQRLVGNVSLFLLEDRTGRDGDSAPVTTRAWVDGGSWSVLNVTGARGRQEFTPGQPMRYFRNGSFAYQTSILDTSDRVVARANVTAQSRLAASHNTLLFPWGYVEAKRVEWSFTTVESTGARSNSTVLHWVHRDYANDVQYQLASGEMFKLRAAKVGDFRRGTLAP